MAEALSANSGVNGESPLRMHPEEVELALQHTLLLLADVNRRYDQERSALESWQGPQPLKERFIGQLEACHRRDREPHVKRLAELHERMMSATMFRDLTVVH